MTTQTNTRLTIAVEGIGHVVQNYYAKALKSQWEHESNRGKISIIFIDKSECWKKSDDKDNIKRCDNFITNLEGWAEYIDKSTEEGMKAYLSLKANVVFIATPDSTHVELALNWLLDENKCESIFIEKPLDSDLSRARVLQFYSTNYSTKIFPLDHYLARTIPLLEKEAFKRIMSSIREEGEEIEQMTFYLLEDRSYPNKGPIENDNRTDAVRKGLVLDMFPHVLALIHHFGMVETIEITSLKVARYTYEDETGKVVPASITRETFANIGFSFKSYLDEPIQAKAYIGKGLAGSRDFKIEGDFKRLEILGKNKNRCIVDLRNTDPEKGGTGEVEIIDTTGSHTLDDCKLLPNPYTVVVQQVIERYLENSSLGWQFYLPIKTAKDCLTCMHEILSLIENFEKTKTEIPPYHIETLLDENGKLISKAPYLEDVMAELKDVREIIDVGKLIECYENKK